MCSSCFVVFGSVRLSSSAAVLCFYVVFWPRVFALCFYVVFLRRVWTWLFYDALSGSGTIRGSVFGVMLIWTVYRPSFGKKKTIH